MSGIRREEIVVKNGCGLTIASYWVDVPVEIPEGVEISYVVEDSDVEALDSFEWEWLQLREPRPTSVRLLPVGRVEGLDEAPTDT